MNVELGRRIGVDNAKPLTRQRLGLDGQFLLAHLATLCLISEHQFCNDGARRGVLTLGAEFGFDPLDVFDRRGGQFFVAVTIYF